MVVASQFGHTGFRCRKQDPNLRCNYRVWMNSFTGGVKNLLGWERIGNGIYTPEPSFNFWWALLSTGLMFVYHYSFLQILGLPCKVGQRLALSHRVSFVAECELEPGPPSSASLLLDCSGSQLVPGLEAQLELTSCLSFIATQVNLNNMLCPAISDPFYGPWYRIWASGHQTLMTMVHGKLITAIFYHTVPVFKFCVDWFPLPAKKIS
ncbi:hypothetical protein EYD10_08992 [Varanus komodoensis]|nr:hypothetical protein EYD10_08992 [Varanus komodoensis]